MPLALARQRLLTATFPYYELKDEARGPVAGFVYKRKQNATGEEVGGIVPHMTSSTIVNDEQPEEEVLVDRPEITSGITRVSGPFCVEATIPTPVDYDADATEVGPAGVETHSSFVERMLEVLRRSPVLQIGAGKAVKLRFVIENSLRRPLLGRAKRRETEARPALSKRVASLTTSGRLGFLSLHGLDYHFYYGRCDQTLEINFSLRRLRCPRWLCRRFGSSASFSHWSYPPNSSSSAFASFKSAVSKPSVNQL